MPGLDTNVLVRWLLDDDAQQTARAEKLFEAARASESMLLVPATVVLELEWVLRSRYRFDKATVLGTFNALLETQELEFQSEPGLERALHLYRLGAAEFADCLHTGLCSASDRSTAADLRRARRPAAERATARKLTFSLARPSGCVKPSAPSANPACCA